MIPGRSPFRTARQNPDTPHGSQWKSGERATDRNPRSGPRPRGRSRWRQPGHRAAELPEPGREGAERRVEFARNRQPRPGRLRASCPIRVPRPQGRTGGPDRCGAARTRRPDPPLADRRPGWRASPSSRVGRQSRMRKSPCSERALPAGPPRIRRWHRSWSAALMLRSRHLAVNMAIVQQARIDTRLHMLFWHLADRWGRTGTRAGSHSRFRLPTASGRSGRRT